MVPSDTAARRRLKTDHVYAPSCCTLPMSRHPRRIIPDPPERGWRLVTWREPLRCATGVYCWRWMLDFGPLGSLRLHHWIASDDKRAPHDHPWSFLTLVVAGRYCDVQVRSAVHEVHEPMPRGSLRWRDARHVHYVEIEPGEECWTLLYMTRRFRPWGFFETLADGVRFVRSTKWFASMGRHPCDR